MVNRQEVIGFYDAESANYSRKRYEGVIESYVQFFFRHRQKLAIKELRHMLAGQKNLFLIDIGCADGLVTKMIFDSLPNTFTKAVGTDISPQMIAVAKRKVGNDKFSFFLKNDPELANKYPAQNFDVALALGYMMPPIFEEEMTFLKKHLKKGGLYVVTVSSPSSIYARLKLRGVPYVREYVEYTQYEKMFAKHFDIIKSVPNGFFVPKLWAVPVLGRLLQPFFEILFRPFVPNVYHEKIYVMRLK